VRNANDGISLIQTAEGATEQVTNMLQRMRELAVQASNDTNNSMDRGFLNGEFQQLRAEIDRIGQNTQWNGANILDGTGGNSGNGTFAFQVGANSRQTIEIKLPNMQTGVDDLQVGASGTGSVTMDVAGPGSSTAVATLDFSNFDHGASGTAAGGAYDATEAQKYLGMIVQVEILDKKFQYQVTQADIDTANRAEASTSGTGSANLGNRVAAALGQKVQAGLGSDFVVHWHGDNSGAEAATKTLTVKMAAGSTSTNYLTANNVSVTTGVKGLLLAIGGYDMDITTADKAYNGLQAIDTALQVVNAQRSNMGAIISRLQFASDNLSNVSAKAAESKSRIEDTDYSVATTELAKRNIIQQAAQAMLAQANQAPQLVLQLLK